MPKTWIFDLDNTLHNADAGIFEIINQAMTKFMAHALSLDEQSASDLREQYWNQYGATLAGLKIHHPQVDLDEFLRVSHPLDLMNDVLTFDKQLHQTLQAITAPKIVFSNGPSFYIQHLLSALKINQHFQATFGVDNVNYLYKPETTAFKLVCHQSNLKTTDCVMIDDSLANLVTAKSLGMKTIWFGPQSHENSEVDFCVQEINELLTIYENGI